jgi:hypothetical protein
MRGGPHYELNKEGHHPRLHPMPRRVLLLEAYDRELCVPQRVLLPKRKISNSMPILHLQQPKREDKAPDCRYCLAGYFSNATGIANYKSYPFPLGYYCPQKYMSAPFECPAGTYNSKTGVGKLSDCLSCPIVNYCPTASVYPFPCRNGTFCP